MAEDSAPHSDNDAMIDMCETACANWRIASILTFFAAPLSEPRRDWRKDTHFVRQLENLSFHTAGQFTRAQNAVYNAWFERTQDESRERYRHFNDLWGADVAKVIGDLAAERREKGKERQSEQNGDGSGQHHGQDEAGTSSSTDRFPQTKRGAVHGRHQTRASHDENGNHDGTLPLSHLEFRTAEVVMESIAPTYLEFLQQSANIGVSPLLKTSSLHLSPLHMEDFSTIWLLSIPSCGYPIIQLDKLMTHER
jgi:hypothetical protein